MGKPFVLQDEQPANVGERGDAVRQANVGRGGNGRFAKLEQPCPGEVAEEAKDTGKSVQETSRANRVPEKAVGDDSPEMSGGDAVYPPSLPWPEAGPVNDAARAPMKLKS